MSILPILSRLDARDRWLYDRCSLGPSSARLFRWSWITITHCGSTLAAVAAVLLPRAAGWVPPSLTLFTTATLALSHAVIQLIKRRVARPRPSTVYAPRVLVADPDRFSFPSGHATAALSVALSYALAYPELAAPLVLFGLLVGWSRVALGVHYPGDVLAGQVIAAATVLGVTLMW